jgi:hypothetical protein
MCYINNQISFDELFGILTVTPERPESRRSLLRRHLGHGSKEKYSHRDVEGKILVSL